MDLTKTQINDLVGAGFLIEAVSGMPNLTMIELVDHLIAAGSASLAEKASINASLSQYLPAIDPWTLLETLKVVLPQLPTDSNSRSRSIAFLLMILFTTPVVALRFYVRKYVTPKQIRAEDWACLAAYFWTVMITMTMWMENIEGHGGNHIWLMTLKQTSESVHIRQWMTVNEFVFVFAHVFTKLNFLVFYYRLSPSRIYRRWVWAAGAYVAICFLVGVFSVSLKCRPFDWWNHFATAKCMNLLSAFTAYGVLMIFADFFILWVVFEIALSVIVSCGPALKVLFFHRSGDPCGLSKVHWTPGGMFKPRSSLSRASPRPNSRKKSDPWAIDSTVKGNEMSKFATTQVSGTDDEEAQRKGSQMEVEMEAKVEVGGHVEKIDSMDTVYNRHSRP